MATIHDSNGNGIGQENPLAVRQVQSDVILPIDIQSRYAQTVQTHNAVSVAISGNSVNATWIDCDGFDKVALTFLNDANATNTVDVMWSNDAVTTHGVEWSILASGTTKERALITDIKARYLKVRLNNGDATLAHTMSAWVYLKA